jgi:serine/threonine protein kinase/tetratricopeptide (TPR) repeat protein
MNPDRWRQIEELYHAALERTADERAIFLVENCGADHSLRQEVESLLAWDTRAEEFITSPPDEIAAAMFATQQLHSLIGQGLGHYQILARLGRGGMGEVYLATDTKLGRKVAVKLLPAQTMPNAQARQRFLREAQAASALNHPGIVTIHAIEEADGQDFIVMEYVEGETLKAGLERGPLEFTSLLAFGSQVAEAVAAAHAMGLVHRDLKPANLMLTPQGQAKVLDFGLAKKTWPLPGGMKSDAATLTGALTDPGMIIGTVAYMSPEQTRGERLDARSDIFSLGVVLYEAATGRAPFAGLSLLALMHAIATFDPPPPGAINPALPREFDQVIAQAMAKDKEQRFNSAAELSAALKSLPGAAPQPLSVFNAGAEQFQTESEVFIGREPEVKQMEEFLRQAVAGSGHVIFITGEPGIGKTTLADEFLRRARRQYPSVICARGRCVEQYGTGEAYLSFLDALGALLNGSVRERVIAALRSHAPTWCLQFPAVFGDRDAREQLQRETIGATRERMIREFGDALAALAANSAVVLLLEDLHWADPSSADLLRHLSQRIGDQRILIVGTFRPADLELSNHPLINYKREMQAHKLCAEIALGMLSAEQVAGYLDARFRPHDLPNELATLIERKTEGHPLFATSLIQFLVERGDIARVSEQWTLRRPLEELDLEAPETVRGLLQKKLDALAEEDRRALMYASIEGEEFLSTVLAQLLGADELELEERLDRLVRSHRLLEQRGEEELPDGALTMRYRFVHVLYQNVLYDEVISRRRILLHRQAGERLLAHYGEQASRIAAQLAIHFERGRDFARATEYLVQAGDNASGIYASAEAAEHYSRALSLVERLPAETQSEWRLKICQKRGAVNHALGRLDQALADFNGMLDEARAVNATEREGAALIALCHTLFFAHRLDDMETRASEALRLAIRSGNEALRAETLAFMGRRHGSLGNLAEATEMLDESLRIAARLNHPPALLAGLSWRGLLCFFQSEYERAEKLLTEALGFSQHLRDGFSILFCHFFLGLTRAERGRISEAFADFDEAMKIARRNGDRIQSLKIPNTLGWIHRELGDLDQAFRYDREGIDVSRQHGLLEAEINSTINLGIDHTARGESEKTDPLFREVESMLERDDWLRWRFNLRFQAGRCEALLAQGQPDEAAACARNLLELASHYQARKYVAIAHRLLAESLIARGEAEAGVKELNAALAVLREYPAPLVEWKIQAALGRLHEQSGANVAAQSAFAAASAIAQMIASQISDERLRTVFLAYAAAQGAKVN